MKAGEAGLSEVFISYARSSETAAQRIAESLRALGFSVWRDDELPPHRPYAEVIQERLDQSKAVLVVWSLTGRVGPRRMPKTGIADEPP